MARFLVAGSELGGLQGRHLWQKVMVHSVPLSLYHPVVIKMEDLRVRLSLGKGIDVLNVFGVVFFSSNNPISN